jgi:NTE family protein
MESTAIQQRPYRIALVLSGGGARGIGHLGAIQALSEMGIRPDVISGTSAGAIIGAFYGAGFSVNEIMQHLGRIRFFSLPNLRWRKNGFFDMRHFEELYSELLPQRTFESLQLPLYIATTDIVRGESVYYNTGDVVKAIMASSCIPLLYQPVSYDGRMLVDGGVLNNFPLEPVRDLSTIVIGVHVNSLSTNVSELRFRDMLDRSFHFALSKQVYAKKALCNVFIDPPNMSRFGMFEIRKADEIFAATYEQTLAMRGEIEQQLRLLAN